MKRGLACFLMGMTIVMVAQSAKADDLPPPPSAPNPTEPAKPETPPPPTGTEVKFVGTKSGDKYKVAAKTSGGTSECEVPCTLHLPPGTAHISVSGVKTYEQDLEVGTEAMRVSLERPCSNCITTGASVMGLGTTLLVLGLFVFPNPSCPSYQDEQSCKRGGEAIGLFFDVVGLIATG